MSKREAPQLLKQAADENNGATASKTGWKRLSGPVKVGLGFALVAIIMAIIGLARGSDSAPVTARSVIMAVVISGGTWGLISWAIATAVVEVERDVRNAEETRDEEEKEDIV
jgi:hypothetical protein